ncbi:glycosyltransferase family 4 protein [Candidatus Symbiopectobacterium sp.]|uniref:glycosyltransferase family 4 protein n=1 Tax=Candidatus Symbiopectobacterium sp. TaxID=2816440 RepID=UPI0025C1D65B|nr:glycosyltransferase family 4 protein [Candidatus Symbiopectobacterium sp.]
MKNKKILFLDAFSAKVSGAQKVAFNIFNSLIALDFDVVTVHRCGSNPVADLYDGTSCEKLCLPFEFFLKKIFGSGNFDGKTQFLKFFHIIKYFFFLILINLWVIYRTKQKKCNYIYTYDIRGLSLVCLFSKLFGIKVIWHLHGEIKNSFILKLIIKNSCYRIICPSEYIKNTIKNDTASVILNGFYFPPYSIVEKEKNVDEINILYVGALTPQKGIHLLIDVLSQKEFLEKKIKLKIVGDYIGHLWYSKFINELIDKSLVHVEMVGWQNNVANYYLWADVVCFTSLERGIINYDGCNHYFKSSEALPTVLIEAIAAGKPVVSTIIAGSPEIVNHGFTGFLVNEDIAQYGNAILKARNLKINCSDIDAHRGKFSLEKMKTEIKRLFCEE